MPITYRPAALLAALLLSGQAVAQDAPIRIATEGAYPPWNTTNAAGELEGFELDLADALCQKMDAECEIVAQDWDGIIPALLAGKYDAIMAGMSITDERRQVIDFSMPYAATPIVFATLSGSELAALDLNEVSITFDEVDADERATLDELTGAFDGMVVAAQGSTTHLNLVEEYFGDVVTVTAYDTMENAANDLLTGRADVMISELPFFNDFAASEAGSDLVVIGPSMTRGPLGEGVGAGIRQADEELIARFNAAIEEAQNDGTIKTLADEWFGFDVTPQ